MASTDYTDIPQSPEINTHRMKVAELILKFFKEEKSAGDFKMALPF